MNTLRPKQISMRLAQLSRTLGRDFHGLSIEFAIERLVARLIQDPQLSKNLVFKGGYVMLKAHSSNRATIDLDTSINGISIEVAETKARSVIERIQDDGLWMGAIEAQDLEHQTKYSGRRLTIRFSIGPPKTEIKRLGKIILDIGVADIITPNPIQTELKPLLGGEPISWSVYPMETIIAEKLHALVVHGSANSRAKDIYDLTLLLKKVEESSVLQKAIDLTFSHRSTQRPESFSDFWRTTDKTMLRRASGAILLATGEQINFESIIADLEILLKII